MMETWRRWPGRLQFLSAWFAFSVVFFIFVWLAHLSGIEVFAGSGGRTRPSFSRSECLERKMHELYGSDISAGDLSDAAQSAVASACTQEEFSGR